MTSGQSTLFPSNPKNGMIFELRSGLYFQYDATVNSWIKVASNTLSIALATPTTNGAMSASDLKKLNRLVLAPPFSSLIGTDCIAPFRGGNISLSSGDKFIGVDGSLNIRNVGSRGEILSKSKPFQIHQHTYGFDFTVNLPELIAELKRRGQFNVVGKQGKKGAIGEDGDPGPDAILTGPPGDGGAAGSGPPCGLTIEQDSLQVEPISGMTKALVKAKVVKDPIDPFKYKLVFDRQAVGPVNFAADKLHVRQDSSPWVLCVAADTPDTTTGALEQASECNLQQGNNLPMPIYYVDIEPIIEAIHREFLNEAGILKKGYEDIVAYWVQVMSDLFDTQKAALCCALQACISGTKSTELRQHMESVAAAAAGNANILLHGRNSKEAVSLSSTRLLKEVGGPDLCRGGPPFPQYPSKAQNPQTSSATAQTLAEEHAQSEGAVDRAIVTIDPMMHSSIITGVHVPLKPGNYTAVIDSTTAQVDGEHRANVKIQHIKKGTHKIVQFLDKGKHQSNTLAQQAYSGLSLSFHHDGGIASFWLPSDTPQVASGSVTVIVQSSQNVPPQDVNNDLTEKQSVSKVEVVQPPVQVDFCEMSISHLSWYERGWMAGNCCGVIINVMGQDYIIVKRSIGNDMGCGGGESESTPCIGQLIKTRGHPAFAWPTFDGKRFAPLPKGEFVTFHFDEKLNEIVIGKIANGDFINGKGNPAGIRHLTYQLTTILFPAG